MNDEQNRPPSPITAKTGRRRPGRPARPRDDTMRRAEFRLEQQRKQADHLLSVDDLEFGTKDVPIHFFARGKVVKRLQMCGRKECRCRRGPQYFHGPYYYLVVTNPEHKDNPDEPKQKWFYLTEDEAGRLKKRIRNFNLFAKNLFADIFDEMTAGPK